MSSDKFFVGIDFGTFKTAIAASNGRRETLPTAVGQPKDHVARAILGRDYIFGEEIVEDELALDVVRPFAKGALKFVSQSEAGISDESGDRCREAAQMILQHAVSLVEPPVGAPVFAVIGAPSRATTVNKHMLTEAARGAFEAVAIVAEPFLVAYSTKRLRKTLIVDIGAGTIDICPLYGTYPSEEDQVTIPIGGDVIDEDFHRRVQQAHPEAQVTVDMAREIKERHGFVHDVNESAVVMLPVDGVPTRFDVTELLKESCKCIVKPIVEGIRQVVAHVHPKLQRDLAGNILLGGGGSQLRGLDGVIEQGLEPLGGGRVTKVYDSLYAGAVGALGLAMAMPPSGWNTLTEAGAAICTAQEHAKAA